MCRYQRRGKFKFKFARWFQSWFRTPLTHAVVAAPQWVVARWVVRADADAEQVLQVLPADVGAEQLVLPQLADVVAELLQLQFPTAVVHDSRTTI